jgi:hypothetical protein
MIVVSYVWWLLTEPMVEGWKTASYLATAAKSDKLDSCQPETLTAFQPKLVLFHTEWHQDYIVGFLV